MDTILSFVTLESSSIAFSFTPKLSKENCLTIISGEKYKSEHVFFKSSEKQLENIEGFWWVELSSRSFIEQIYRNTSKEFQIKGYLHLQIYNEGWIESGILAEADFAFGPYRAQKAIGINGVQLPFTLEHSKSVFTAIHPHDLTNQQQTIDLTVNLTLKKQRLVKVDFLRIAQSGMAKHWIKTKSFSILQDQDDFKDFTFLVGNQQFKIHKCVFSASSDVLTTMFKSGFDESKKNAAKITDIEPDVFKIFIHFMYGNKDEFEKTYESFVYAVYRAAHKYQIKVLQDFCVDYISKNCTGSDRAIETYTFASFYDLKKLKDQCWPIIRDKILKDSTIRPPAAEDVQEFFASLQHYQESLEKIKCQIKQKMTNMKL